MAIPPLGSNSSKLITVANVDRTNSPQKNRTRQTERQMARLQTVIRPARVNRCDAGCASDGSIDFFIGRIPGRSVFVSRSNHSTIDRSQSFVLCSSSFISRRDYGLHRSAGLRPAAFQIRTIGPGRPSSVAVLRRVERPALQFRRERKRAQRKLIQPRMHANERESRKVRKLSPMKPTPKFHWRSFAFIRGIESFRQELFPCRSFPCLHFSAPSAFFAFKNRLGNSC
jgi:hypothetical protein